MEFMSNNPGIVVIAAIVIIGLAIVLIRNAGGSKNKKPDGGRGPNN